MKKKIDLHMHTNYSDGQLNLFDIIELAKSYGVSAMAITDHDTIINLRDIEKLAELYGIEIIPGIEISVGKPCNMHILGYGIKDLKKVEDHIQKVKYSNIEICENVIKLLQKNGYEISLDEIFENMEKRREQNMKDAERIKEKYKEKNLGDIDVEPTRELLDKRSIAKLLVAKGYAKNNKEVYDKIMGQGCENYIPINKISAKDAIELIHEAGGVAVLAHPFLITQNEEELEKLIKQLKEIGLDGIEILNVGAYEINQSIQLRKWAKEEGLIETIGSDFHRKTDKNNFLGIEAEESILEILKAAIQRKNKEYDKKEKGKDEK